MPRTLALTAAEPARRVNLSASATKERVRRLEEAEVIQGDGPPDLGIADHPVLRSAEARYDRLADLERRLLPAG
ncbi:winged helix-turn-helix transcriptional regulator [Streptomyces sp. ID05-47C]|uniref:winged helix-turn-helix transcriptional regulator n=1 Tax=Streptomyces sp. ID05-47C TaxID=3028665 RepID=UPI0029A35606|nr:winged helix-turn-helix transcriptional regulator [Streptomyces sp. ID05-47C]MDX3568376.1 winged helix-turn-helix transcriptional regulator [Streptomyces sp. ID05-47C]